jgi:hypothetical protein
MIFARETIMQVAHVSCFHAPERISVRLDQTVCVASLMYVVVMGFHIKKVMAAGQEFQPTLFVMQMEQILQENAMRVVGLLLNAVEKHPTATGVTEIFVIGVMNVALLQVILSHVKLQNAQQKGGTILHAVIQEAEEVHHLIMEAVVEADQIQFVPQEVLCVQG